MTLPAEFVRKLSICAVLSGALASGPAAAQALTELMRQVLATEPAVAGAAAQLRAAQERVTQAAGAFGPTASINASSADTRYQEAPAFDLRPFRSTQAALQITLPVLRAALIPAAQGAQSQQLQAQAALSQAQAEAVQRLVEAAFEMLKARDTLTYVRAQQVATGEQLALARRAHQVGTVPLTDVRDAEAKGDAVAAQVIAAEAELSLRQQTLATIAGTGSAALLARGLDGRQLPAVPPDSALGWLADAMTGSPQIAQAQHAVQVAEAELRKAWLQHAPTADLTYAYTMSKDTGTVTSSFPRRGDTSAIGVNVTIPLFSSGVTQSRVRESMALRDKAQADLETAQRAVTLAVRQAFSATLAAIAQARGLEAAVRSQELALRAARRGYEAGTKANADVLDAQSKLFDARRDLSRARYDAWNGYIKLKSQSGLLAEGDLAQLDGLLVDAPVPALLQPRRPGT